MANNKKLSAEARGVLEYLADLKESGEVIDRDKIRERFGFGPKKVTRLTNELKAFGLLELVRNSDSRGRFVGWSWRIPDAKHKTLYGTRARIEGSTKRARAQVLVKVLTRIKTQVHRDKHFREVLDAAISEIENTQRPVEENLEAIVEAVGKSHAHTYEEISEDLPLPIDITRRYVKLLISEGRLEVIKRLVAQTNNTSHLIVSVEHPCDCFPGEPIEFSDDLRNRV